MPHDNTHHLMPACDLSPDQIAELQSDLAYYKARCAEAESLLRIIRDSTAEYLPITGETLNTFLGES